MKTFRLALLVFILSGLFFWSLQASALPTAGVEGVRLPILMYHGVTRVEKNVGTYVIHEDRLREDIRYLQEKGYTMILPAELMAWDRGEGNLPDKPILLTFDDGGLCMLDYVLPILIETDSRALCAVVGEFIEKAEGEVYKNPEFSSLDRAALIELAESPRMEIAAHSMHMHNLGSRRGIGRKKGEGAEAYRSALRKDTRELHRLLEGFGIEPKVYAYPYGIHPRESESVLREMGYAMTLTCEEGVNVLRPGDGLFDLKRFNRPGDVSTEVFMKQNGIG